MFNFYDDLNEHLYDYFLYLIKENILNNTNGVCIIVSMYLYPSIKGYKYRHKLVRQITSFIYRLRVLRVYSTLRTLPKRGAIELGQYSCLLI